MRCDASCMSARHPTPSRLFIVLCVLAWWQWEQHRSREFLREALGAPHKDHSSVTTKFPEGVLPATQNHSRTQLHLNVISFERNLCPVFALSVTLLQLLPRDLPLKVVYGNSKDLLTLAKGDFHAVHEESGRTYKVDVCAVFIPICSVIQSRVHTGLVRTGAPNRRGLAVELLLRQLDARVLQEKVRPVHHALSRQMKTQSRPVKNASFYSVAD